MQQNMIGKIRFGLEANGHTYGTIALPSLPETPIDVDVPGHDERPLGAEVGMRFPERGAVLVPVPAAARGATQ